MKTVFKYSLRLLYVRLNFVKAMRQPVQIRVDVFLVQPSLSCSNKLFALPLEPVYFCLPIHHGTFFPFPLILLLEM